MAINNNNIIVGLDIGTTKVCAIVGQMAENGKSEMEKWDHKTQVGRKPLGG